MRRRITTGAAAFVLGLATTAAPATAAGFGIFEQGTKAMGTGMAFTARADDPSTLFYNAGGLAFFDEREFAAGVTFIMSTEASFDGSGPLTGYEADQETLFETPPHFYWVEPISDDWNFGLALNSPFGLTTEWENPEEFAGRYISVLAALRTFDLNPTVGWQVTPNVGVGFGAVARFSDVELNRFVPTQIPGTPIILDVGRVELESDLDSGFGWNIGLLHRYNESFSWGLSYRSKVKVDYGGDARFTQILTGIPPIDIGIRQVIPFDVDVPVETEIEFPDMASLGGMVAINPNVHLELDVNWTGWSSFDELPITFLGYPLLDSKIPQDWDDAMNYRLGLSWLRPSGCEWRFGYIYDETPQPDEAVSPLLPDANRNGFTVGWGKEFTKASVDLALMYLPFDERTTSTNHNNFNGTYNTTSWLFGATIGF